MGRPGTDAQKRFSFICLIIHVGDSSPTRIRRYEMTRTIGRLTSGIAVMAVVGVASTYAVPGALPLYTFCELEDNDACEVGQKIDASAAVAFTGFEESRDCFYITGKLQKDCVWDIQPKCGVIAFGKPVAARNSNGQVIPGAFVEPILAQGQSGQILNLAPNDDRTIRLGVSAGMDTFDGTVNGLAQNAPHGEFGEVTVKIFYNNGNGAGNGPVRGIDEADDEYVFRFQNGADALRAAFIIPSGVSSVDVLCCNDTGMVEICYDVDHYEINNLIPAKPYCLTVVGGLTYDCEKTDTVLGWFNKNCELQSTNDNGGQDVFSRLCVFADGDGTIRFAVSGAGDLDFDGLIDEFQKDFYDFLDLYNTLNPGANFEFRTGASLKDASFGHVIRYPRRVWDGYITASGFPSPLGQLGAGYPPESLFQHGVCGGYTIKVELGEHVDLDSPNRPADSGNGDTLTGPALADLNGDGVVNAQDLAILLSFWGMTTE
ncbi:MAG: hypothetical protein EA376_06615 [Phycisphaeraceae bacterium]|nr:MAG: hypothetical protein EA376_06615 [Phycisphaeraceae bacterium]